MATYSVSLDKELNSKATAKAAELELSVEEYIRSVIRRDTEGRERVGGGREEKIK